jgi:hypothetical protein
VQSLAEQKHALKISEHTFIIMYNNKAGYNSYSKMSKRTYTYCTAITEIWGPRTNFDLGALVIPCSNTMIRGPGASPGKSLKSEVPEMAKSCILGGYWTVISMRYISLQFFICIYLGPPLTRVPGQIAPLWTVTTICDSLVS